MKPGSSSRVSPASRHGPLPFVPCPFPFPFPASCLRPCLCPVPVPVPMKPLDHERMDVYRIAIELVRLAETVAQGLPRGRAYLRDQLQRAATSIPLNVAEGAGEFRPLEKARFYRMARRSATECSGILDVCATLEFTDTKTLEEGKELLARIVSMLVRLSLRLEGSGPGGGTGGGTTPGTGTGTNTGHPPES